ncbi:hypothetical protein [Pseudoalteromonas xiamenensis]|uniref:Uncharacterized protein n=1 Tax=Pseudoalteromonas xiamenensis TaxID=882626 RepID=A0A975DFF8_9GAMM|nr:hypothetical protein [Pseudoalteromonas xiamenensis]QTH70589.1 hypothetical protein J5O05_11585 [Pseudoalteromonas xiamenensis]
MKKHKRVKEGSGTRDKSKATSSVDEYLNDMKQIDRKAKFYAGLEVKREIASLNKYQRELYAKMQSWNLQEMARVQLEARDFIKSLADITNDKIAFMLTLTAKKYYSYGFNLKELIATGNRFLYFFSKGNYVLNGWAFLELKEGWHPHLHIILYQNEDRTGLSTNDYIKPLLQFGFAMNQCLKLNPEHCDITPVLCDPEYLVADYLMKEAGVGIEMFDLMEPLHKGQIDGGRLIEKFGVIINEV